MATNTYDLTIHGASVAIHTSDANSLVVDVDGQRFTYDPSLIADIDVAGVGEGSTLTVDDHAHATAQYLAYGLDYGQVSINSRQINYDPGVQNVVLWTSNFVANSVDVHATSEETKAWINAGAAPTTVNAHLHEGFGRLLSDVKITGNANTTLNTYDEPGIQWSFVTPPADGGLLLDLEDLGLGGGDTVDGEVSPPPSTNQYVTANSVYDPRTPGKVTYQGIGGLTVHGDNGTDQITVLSTGAAPVTLVGGLGDTTFVVGNTSFGADQIQSLVNVEGNPEALSSVLIVDDHPRPVGTYSKHYELDEAAVHLQQQVDVQYSGLTQLVLKTAVWGAVQVDVNGSAASTPVEIDLAAQVTSVNVNFHSPQGHEVLGDVTVVGSGHTTLHTYDWTTEPAMYTIRDNSVAEEGGATVYYSGLANLTVMGGDGDDVFSVFGTAAGAVTDIGGGYGSDEFVFMDDNYTMDSIQGEVYLDGEPENSWNIDYVVFYDYFNTAEQTYTFTADAMQRSGMAGVHYADMCEVILYSSCLAASWINVESVDAGALLNLAVSDGDTVYIGQSLGDGTATLSGILGDVDVNSMGGSPRVIVDSSADVDSHETSTGEDGWGVYLDGLAPGRLYFNYLYADEIEFIPGADIAALDAFYSLLGSVEE